MGGGYHREVICGCVQTVRKTLYFRCQRAIEQKSRDIVADAVHEWTVIQNELQSNNILVRIFRRLWRNRGRSIKQRRMLYAVRC